MADPSTDDRLRALLDLVLEVADGNYAARVEPSEHGDVMDAAIVGLNLVAESLELERERRRRAERLLRDEVHAYEQAPACFCSVDNDTLEIVKCNETLARTIGVRKEDLMQRRLLNLLPLDERPVAEAALDAIRCGRKPDQTTFHLNTTKGASVPVLLSGSVADAEATRLRLVMRDVSHERSLEDQLRHAQKLEAVGRLASGVAHDFNNILAVVMGSASLLKRILPEEHRGRREIAAIINAAENGTGLTQQLLALSSPNPKKLPSVTSVDDVIKESQPLLLRALGPANELVLNLASPDLPVRIDPSELVQVLLNLTVNARDAMPNGGRLVVRTSLEAMKDGTHRVVLEVADEGHGMAAHVLARVREPFYTTKADSGGTGLGLAVCLRIVEQWRGGFDITSEPGCGTVVRIHIPAAEHVAERDERPGHAPRVGEDARRILVVDDEPLVRGVLQQILEDDGYEVIAADSPRAALDIHAELDSLDLVVTDVVMPHGSGVELAHALWEARPELGVVFVSGYTGERIDSSLLERKSVRFLGKPFAPEALLDLVAELTG